MKQISFAQDEHQNKKKVTRRERFLARMEKLVPWQRLIAALSPSYFPNSAGKRGRPPIGLERMLRIYFLQQWYALADEALEDAIYDSQAMRDFIGIDLAIESVPDATTLLRFRHLLEQHALTQRIFEEINAHLAEQGLFMREGTIVDATIVAAAPSTRNKARQRDPEMKQTKKDKKSSKFWTVAGIVALLAAATGAIYYWLRSNDKPSQTPPRVDDFQSASHTAPESTLVYTSTSENDTQSDLVEEGAVRDEELLGSIDEQLAKHREEEAQPADTTRITDDHQNEGKHRL
mgnify:CR=1 FL=1